MPATEAQLAANRRNAQRSTGPRTAEGKARARGNAVQHGLTGAGLALPPELLRQVESEFAAVRAELRPRTTFGAFLLHQATLASVRCRQAARHESASLARRVRHAVADWDDRRAAEVDHALDHLGDDPATHRRLLLRSPEGTTRLVEALVDLRRGLLAPQPVWDAARGARLEHLLGRRSEALVPSVIAVLSRAALGDARGLEPDRIAHLPDLVTVQGWARHQLAEAIAAEVDQLAAHFEGFDFAAIEADRVEAPERALFDPGPEATLARRYEASHSRLFFRALREFRAVEADASHARAHEDCAWPAALGDSRSAVDPAPPPTGPATPEPVVNPPPAAPGEAQQTGGPASVVDLAIGRGDRPAAPDPSAGASKLGSFGAAVDQAGSPASGGRPSGPTDERLAPPAGTIRPDRLRMVVAAPG